jgi:hypothetical protein
MDLQPPPAYKSGNRGTKKRQEQLRGTDGLTDLFQTTDSLTDLLYSAYGLTDNFILQMVSKASFS